MSDTPGPSRGSQLLEEWQGKWTQAQAADVLRLDTATYNRFVNGVRRPSAEIGFAIERDTEGKVPAKSWYEPAIKQAGAQAS